LENLQRKERASLAQRDSSCEVEIEISKRVHLSIRPESRILIFFHEYKVFTRVVPSCRIFTGLRHIRRDARQLFRSFLAHYRRKNQNRITHRDDFTKFF